jgi:hypothetical protein
LATQGEAKASIQRDSGRIVGEYMKEQDVPPGPDFARYGVHHIFAEALTSMGRVSADDGDLGVSGHLHGLASHGYQLPVIPNAKEPPELMGASSEGAWLGQFDEVAHSGYVSLAQFDDACANNVAY